MRFTIAYYLMLVYVIVALKPLVPFIHDAWSHEFNEIEHISLVHSRYGSHHLEKELAETDGNNDKNKNQSALKMQDQVSLHIMSLQCKFDLVAFKTNKQYFNVVLNKLPSVYLLKQGQPPKIF